MLPQSGFTPDALAGQLEKMLATPDILRDAAAKAAGRGHVEAAERLADLIDEKVPQESVP
jgi:UDP-N-acetylglucosamine:LPS N-acetylglucosamine transferase